MGSVFRAIDPDMNGRIVFEEFWALLEGPLSKVIDHARTHYVIADTAQRQH